MWDIFYEKILTPFMLFRATDIIDILVVTYLVYVSLKFIRDTRTGRLLKGLVLIFLVTQASAFLELSAVNYILTNVLQLGLVALLIVFQPELRRALEHVGRTSMSKWFDSKGEFDKEALQMVKEVAHSAQALSNTGTGALIVIENTNDISPLISSGIRIDAVVTSELLENIFVVNTPLHDGAVVIRDNRVEFATCVLPLSQNPTLSQELGTRHRAGLGISEESDAVVVIVSEETARISIAYRGALETGFNEDTLNERIIDLLNSSVLNKNVDDSKINKLKNLLKGGERK